MTFLSRLLGRPAPCHVGRSYYVTSLVPILPGHATALTDHLARLSDGTSPFAALEEVHFGRWLVLDGLRMSWPGAPRRPSELRSQYLLFTACITAADSADDDQARRSFLTHLATAIPGPIDAVWQHCLGYPGSGDIHGFVDYLSAGELDTVLFHVGYPDATVAQVTRAIATRDALIAFASRHQGPIDPAVLQAAYVEESPTWG